jgi:hypothetical protein
VTRSTIEFKYEIAMAALCKIKNGVKAPRKFAEKIMLELVAMPNQEDDFRNVLIDENGHFELVDQDDTPIQ